MDDDSQLIAIYCYRCDCIYDKAYNLRFATILTYERQIETRETVCDREEDAIFTRSGWCSYMMSAKSRRYQANYRGAHIQVTATVESLLLVSIVEFMFILGAGYRLYGYSITIFPQ